MSSRVTRSTRQQQQQLQPPQQNEQQNRARWTTSLTKTLVKVMVEQVYKGNRHNNCFDKRAWNEICDGFYTRTGLKWEKEQLKNRYVILKKQYSLMKFMLDKGYFVLDETTGIISGSVRAWSELIKEHPDAEPLKSNGCPIYKDLCVIFLESTIATGSTPNRDPMDPCQVSSSGSEEPDGADRRETACPSSGGPHKRRRKGIDGAIADAMLAMASASRMKTSAAQRRDARYSITECIRELDAMDGVDEPIYLAALELFDARIARETFLSLKGEKRLIWLRGKCVMCSMF